MIVVGLVVYLVAVGLDRADKLASAISAVAALVALAAPYLLPVPRAGCAPTTDSDQVTDTGTARATNGGQATSGIEVADDDRPAQVTRSGNAIADGPGSVANTGVSRRPRP